MSQAATLRIDPFFDDEEEGFSPGNEPGVKIFARAYKDPNSERLKDGRSIVSIAGSGPSGIRGVLIPHATQGGVPENIDPNNIRDIEINIDPQLPGQSAQIRLGDLHDALTMQSIEEARDMCPDASTPARRRRRASTAYRMAAEHIKEGDIERPEETELAQPARRATTSHRRSQAPQVQAVIRDAPAAHPAPARTMASLPSFQGTAPAPTPVAPRAPAAFGPPPMQRPAARSGSMMGAFAPPPPAQPTYEPPVAQAPAAPVGAAAPTRHVTFEIQHFGHIDAYYHDIDYNQDTGKIILVYDTRYSGGMKWFPPKATAESPPMAMMEENGQNIVCLVAHSGVQYSYEGKEFCILDCHQVGQLPPE